MDTGVQTTVEREFDTAQALDRVGAGAAPVTVLLVLSESGDVQVVPLADGATLSVGRGEPAQLRLSDPSISRVHARFHSTGGRVTVTDLDSRNGTFVGGQAVREAVLGPGDTAVIGSVTVSVQVVTPRRNGEGPESPDDDPHVGLRASLRHHEAKLIHAALSRTGGNQRMAAELLELPLRTFERKLANLGTRTRKGPDDALSNEADAEADDDGSSAEPR